MFCRSSIPGNCSLLEDYTDKDFEDAHGCSIHMAIHKREPDDGLLTIHPRELELALATMTLRRFSRR